MKKIYLSAILFLSFISILHAQIDKKYLAGAVPEENGKVVFSQTFELPELSQKEIFQRVSTWANANYHDENNRIVYSDTTSNIVSCRGNEELIFKSSALVLDKATMFYQLNIFCENGSCKAEIKSISYSYNSTNQNAPDRYKAEEWITDKEAVRKNKLYRNNGKFRIKTIDLTDDIFYSLKTTLQSGKRSYFREEEIVMDAKKKESDASTQATSK